MKICRLPLQPQNATTVLVLRTTMKRVVQISEPVQTYARIRRMVHPYEVESIDTYEQNAYAPKSHNGVEQVISTSESGKEQPQILTVENPVDQSTSKFYVDGLLNSAMPRKDKSYASQQVVFDTIGVKLVNDVMTGYNTSLVCIGAQGSGKTYTLFGPKPVDGSSTLPPSRDTGLVPRFCQQLFQRISKSCQEDSVVEDGIQISYLVEFSAYEIRSEHVYDLLNPADYDVQLPCTLKAHPNIGMHVQNLVCLACTNASQLTEAVEAARSSLATTTLFRGTIGSHDHAVYQFTVTRKVEDNLGGTKGGSGDGDGGHLWCT